jgi:biopolymer transport protein ExbD
MGYDRETQHSSNSTALWVVGIVGVLGVLMFGGLVLGGILWTSNVQSQVAQRQVALDIASEVSVPREVAATPTTTRYNLYVTQSGKVQFGGVELDVSEVIARLQQEQRTIHEVLLTADPQCPFQHVAAVITACHEAGFADVTVTPSR